MAVRDDKPEVRSRLKASDVVAILRTETPDGSVEVAHALVNGETEFVRNHHARAGIAHSD
jgi:2-keto-3-deoxy-6-phosphogluconate aldolase